jgi:hypothetical protein
MGKSNSPLFMLYNVANAASKKRPAEYALVVAGPGLYNGQTVDLRILRIPKFYEVSSWLT